MATDRHTSFNTAYLGRNRFVHCTKRSRGHHSGGRTMAVTRKSLKMMATDNQQTDRQTMSHEAVVLTHRSTGACHGSSSHGPLYQKIKRTSQWWKNKESNKKIAQDEDNRQTHMRIQCPSFNTAYLGRNRFVHCTRRPRAVEEL